jgi:hypothetical protein
MCFPAAPFARHICIKSLITHVHTPAVHCTCFHLHRLRASLACYVCVLRLRATFACSIYINNTHTHTHTCSALHVPPCCVVCVLRLHAASGSGLQSASLTGRPGRPWTCCSDQPAYTHKHKHTHKSRMANIVTHKAVRIHA